MSYFFDAELAEIKRRALEDARHNDDLWSFVHSTLMRMVESQGGKYVGHKRGDGFYKVKLIDVNSGAEHIQVALDVRSEFLQERAENDKSS